MNRAPFLLIATLGAAAPVLAHDDTGYEPCHLLCVLPSGRTGSRAEEPDGSATGHKFTARLELVAIEPQGHYEKDRYVPLARGAEITVLEILPSLTYTAAPDWLVAAGWPWEYNRSTGVTLPTLHAAEGTTSEFAGGGVWISGHHRFDGVSSGIRPWASVGYRFSSPKGTTDVEDELAAYPDRAIEGLGIGSDDLYVGLALELSGDGAEDGRLWLGGEHRLHMLPRWQRVFATTNSYDLLFTQPMTAALGATFGLSGFQTYIPSLGVLQGSLAIPALGGTYRAYDRLSFDMSVSTQVHGKRPLNQNTLRTVDLRFGSKLSF